ncbi:peptidase inhibitor family I36 protein [Streptomyces sp. NPDC050509]|uniref:peptidase inhibitor family I36 protein n=1 Tax=Streptomyces sp. NPDC050509 TaxID=3365620 RepID=UPI003792A6D2
MKKAALCAALGLAAVAMAAMPTAQASPTTARTYADCPAGWFCAWEHEGGKGKMVRFQNGVKKLSDFGMNDKISSVWNRSGQIFCTYLDNNYKGATWAVGSWQGNTAKYHRNDNISSLRAGEC